MKAFTYTVLPTRVVFGVGALDQLMDEIERLGAQRVLVLSTREQRAAAEDVARRIGGRAAGIYDRAVMHTPIEAAEDARAVAVQLQGLLRGHRRRFDHRAGQGHCADYRCPSSPFRPLAGWR